MPRQPSNKGESMKKPRTHQEELERVSRALRTLSGSNRALLRAEDEASLLREICRVVVEEAGYYSALVSRAEHDEDKIDHPIGRWPAVRPHRLTATLDLGR